MAVKAWMQLEFLRLDPLHEPFDVGAGDEGLAGTAQDNGAHVGAGIGGVEGAAPAARRPLR
jgi:hypothetical protein